MTIKERYFGDRDPLEIVDDQPAQESPQAAAIRQAKQIARETVKTTLMERLLEERTKQALEESRKQVRQIAEAAEGKVKELQENLELYQGVLQRIAEGKMTKDELREFIASRGQREKNRPMRDAS